MSELWRVEHALETVRHREESLARGQEELAKAAGWAGRYDDETDEMRWFPPRSAPHLKGMTLEAACDSIREALSLIGSGEPEPTAAPVAAEEVGQ